MSTTCIHQVALECTTGGSNKLYVIQVTESVGPAGTTYTTTGFYGAIGATLKSDEKYTGASKLSAMAAANKLEKDKRKKYVDHAVTAGTPVRGMPSTSPVYGGPAMATAAAPSPAPAVPKGRLPMLASVLPEDELEAMILNRDAVFQRKYDGERAIISLRRGAIVRTNRNGFERAISAVVEEELKKLWPLPDFRDELETIIDGELMDDVFIAYDMLVQRDNDICDRDFDERFANLEVLLEDTVPHLLAETAYSEEEKRAMLKKAQDEKWEGIMVRLGSSEYKVGRCKNIFKYKLWATATCRVLSTNSGVRSVQLALRDEKGDDVFCGNVTVPPNQDIPEAYSLVEVRYLYAMEGGSLYQPVLMRPRDDVDECDLRSDMRQAPPERRKEVEKEPEPAI